MMGWNTNSIYKVRAGQHSIEQMDKLGQGNQLKNQLAKLHADQYYICIDDHFLGFFSFNHHSLYKRKKISFELVAYCRCHSLVTSTNDYKNNNKKLSNMLYGFKFLCNLVLYPTTGWSSNGICNNESNGRNFRRSKADSMHKHLHQRIIPHLTKCSEALDRKSLVTLEH